MPASFNWEQTIGAPGAQTSSLRGSTGNLFDFKNSDTMGVADYVTYPISAGNNSYELWLRGFFGGSYNTVTDLRFWMSQDFSPNTGLTVKFTGTQQTYAQPTNLSSSFAVSTVSTSDPGTANVSVGSSLNSSITLSMGGYTDYLVLQLQTQGNAAAGDTSLSVFSMSYVEN